MRRFAAAALALILVLPAGGAGAHIHAAAMAPTTPTWTAAGSIGPCSRTIGFWGRAQSAGMVLRASAVTTGHLLAPWRGASVPMRDRRRKAAYAIVASVLAIMCQEDSAQAADVQAFRFGRDLVSDCVGRDLDFCTGYVAGIADLMTSLYAVTGNPKFRACLPPGMMPTDLAKVVVDFIGTQKALDADASGSVFFAIRDKFPCPGA